MTPLISNKMFLALVKLVRQGVPIFAAAQALAIRRAVIAEWMAQGATDEPPGPPPKLINKRVEWEKGVYITEGELHMHTKLCWALHEAVTKAEGERVGNLFKTMWSAARRLQGASDRHWLANRYDKVHGLFSVGDEAAIELAKAKAAAALRIAEEDEGGEDEEERVQLYLPDNGRST